MGVVSAINSQRKAGKRERGAGARREILCDAKGRESVGML